MQSYTVTSDYFKTLGLRMVQGREFTAAEEATVGGTTREQLRAADANLAVTFVKSFRDHGPASCECRP